MGSLIFMWIIPPLMGGSIYPSPLMGVSLFPSPLMGEGRGEGKGVKERCPHLYPPPKWGRKKRGCFPRSGSLIISLSLDGRGQG